MGEKDGELTPGKINPIAEHLFLQGACGALALALHERLGWPIYAVTDAHNVFEDGRAGGGSALHWVVRHPQGDFVDISGLRDKDSLIEDYEDEADDAEAAIGLSTAADVTEWYIECQGAPVSIRMASEFVEPLLERIEEQLLNAPRPPSIWYQQRALLDRM